MHTSMYRHPLVMENVRKLQTIGVEVLMPRFEEDKAKIPDTHEIVGSVVRRLEVPKDLEGRRILITGGPTREYIDGFRFISNPSSGKMAVALAEVALRRGAKVTLVYGKGTAVPPASATVVSVDGTEEMLDAVVDALKTGGYDAVILSAAAADYKASEREMVKTPSGLDNWTVELTPLPKIIEQVKKVDPNVFLVGFKAEYAISDEELISRARKRMEAAEMDLVVANDVARKDVGFGTDTNEVFIIDRAGNVIHTSLEEKEKVAEKVLNAMIKRLGK
jgi:phosphopantothenoylcysteine decarboxylase/phosphopantothenate--cysteine ligase